ncbi:Kri1-like, C-terminal [Artemisia annua]|uniref:Kri1-like, C-terminal n=1 Tax=Artemisia annua TaxID=35608 RepID=A0A2U1MAS2_ARTAN|nr:Kri1-like, C-terminal [Artemisia annua]
MKHNILSDSDGGASDSDDLNTITINPVYAKRYEHNKKREDLHRYEELKLRKLIEDEHNEEYDDSSGEDDEEDDVIKFDPKHEVQFVDALLKIRNNDPVLKNKEVELFDDVASDDVAEEGKVKKEKKKKVYLKDVNANLLLENGADFDDVADDDDDVEKDQSFYAKMEAGRKEFLDAVVGEGEGEDEGEIFKVKEGGNEDEEEEDEDEVEYEKKLDEYFKSDDKLSENDKGFLRDFFAKKMWLEKDEGNNGNVNDGFDGFDIDVSDDDEIMWRQEDFEREINFRHQEGGEDRVMVHPRKIEGSVRKVESARQRQRESKKEREAERKIEMTEEIKRLKNVKKEEMNEKLKKFREIAGIGEGEDCVLDVRDLEGDFDPEEYDRKMKKAFDDKFYNAKDVDPNFASEEDDDDEDGEMEKPNFDEEDELLGLPKGWDDKFGSGDGFAATRAKVLKKKGKNDVHEEEVVEEEEAKEEEETEIKEGKKKRKRKTSKLEEEFIKKQLEEFYKLDCEDTIGDLKTRFKYKPVKENNYGLKAKDILVVDDKELNQLIPLKKLATYREDEFHVPYNKIKETKQRIRSQLKGESSSGPDNGGKRSKNDAGKPVKQVGDAETENPESETQNEGEKKQSRKQRRKERLQELKLAPTRRMAYNLDVPKKKKKNKA